MFSIKIALSLLLVLYLLYHNMNLYLKYRSKQKVDRLTLMAQMFFFCEKFFKLLRDTNFYQQLHHEYADNRLFVTLYSSRFSLYFQYICYITLQAVWIDIIFMVKSLKGDDVIEVKKKRFNSLEKKLLLILQIIIVSFLIATLADTIFRNIYC